MTPPVPDGEVLHEGSGVPPLGLMYLAAALLRAGHGVALVDAAWKGLSPAEATKDVLSLEPSLVGFTSTTAEYPRAVALLKQIKGQSTGIRCMIGGPHVTHRPAEALTDGFDAVVRGEGEEAVVALAGAGKLSECLPNNVVVPGSTTHSTQIGSMDVASLPWPARGLVDLDRYHFPGVMVTARGCPHGCYFCSVSRRAGAFRPRPDADVLREAADLRFGHRMSRIDLLDDTFLASRERALRLGSSLGKLGIEWAAEGRVDEILVLGKGLAKLVDCGLTTLFLGIESGDDAVLRRAKGLSLEDARRAVALAWAAGVPAIRASFIIGHPWDTEMTIEGTEGFMLELLEEGVDISVALLTPYPGSIPGDRPELLGLKIRSTEYQRYTGMWALLDTQNLSAEWLQDRYLDILDKLLEPAHVDTREPPETPCAVRPDGMRGTVPS